MAVPPVPCVGRGGRRQLCAAVLVAMLQGGWPIAASAADWLLINGRIATLDAQSRVVEAMAITGDRIVATGVTEAVRARAGATTRTIDLGGRTVIPGPRRFTYPCDPGGPSLRDRGELDRRHVDRRGAGPDPLRGCHQRRPARGSSSAAAGPQRNSPSGDVRRRPRSSPQRRAAASMSSCSTARCCCRPRAGRHSAWSSERRPAAGRQARARRERPSERLDRRRSRRHHGPVRPAAGAIARRQHRRARAGSWRSSIGSASPASSIPAATTSRRRTTRPLLRLCASRRAHRARRLLDLRAAARQRARRPAVADPLPADGRGRRHAALQRHRRARHVGALQQRQAERRRRSRTFLRARALGRRARAHADRALEQRPLGASSAGRARARRPRNAVRVPCAGRSRTCTTPPTPRCSA